MSSQPKKLCILHARADSGPVDDLVKRWRPATDRGDLICWHLSSVPPGADVEEQLAAFLPQADGVLLWISPELWDAGLYTFFRKNQSLLRSDVRILPVLARYTDWESDPLLSAHAADLLPADRQPLPTEPAERRDAWLTGTAYEIAVRLGMSKRKKPATPAFWTRWNFWERLIAVAGLLVACVALFLAYPSFVADSHENEAHESAHLAPPAAPAGCGFPAAFDSTQLYILITRFEDYDNSNETECYGRGIESRIDLIKNRDHLPIKICYLDSLSPNQSDEAARWRDYYHADLIVWGKLRNAGANCQADGFCLKFQPSDTLVQYAGGQLAAKVDNDFKPNIKASDLESGLISMGAESFDAWLIGVFNLKIGRRKPEFYQILEEWPVERKVEEYEQRGKLFYFLNDFGKALVDFDKAIALKPSADLLFYHGNTVLALGLKEAAIEDYNLAMQLDQSGRSEFYNNRGTANSNLGRYKAAIMDYDQAIAIDSNDAYKYFNRGSSKSKMGQKEAAIIDFNHAIRIDSTNAEAYYGIGIAKDDLGLYESSIEAYDQAIKIDSNYAAAYNNRGHAKARLGQYKASIIDYNHAIRINPNYALAYNNLGAAKSKIGQYETAIENYNRAIQIDSKFAIAYNNCGIVKSAIGQFEAAIANYDQAIRLNPQNANYYFNRGRAKFALGRKEAAIADYDRAIQLNPQDGDYYCNRGNAKDDLGQKEAAIADYNYAIQLNPQDGDSYHNRGFVKAELGQNEAAIADYSQAIRVTPNNNSYYARANAYYNQRKYLPYLIDTAQAWYLTYSTDWRLYALLILLSAFLFRRRLNKILEKSRWWQSQINKLEKMFRK